MEQAEELKDGLFFHFWRVLDDRTDTQIIVLVIIGKGNFAECGAFNVFDFELWRESSVL